MRKVVPLPILLVITFMKSKLLGLMALVSLVLALSGGAASAVTFDWSTTGPTGSGTFTATDDGSGQYTITDITGTFEGYNITELSLPGTYYNDNLLFYPVLPDSPQLDSSGVSFLAADPGNALSAYAFNLNFQADSGYGYTTVFFPLSFLGNSYGGIDTFAASTSVTPLPAALPLFATGIGAMGLLGWRRKRKNAGVIAAA